jgi:hypothetical protein
LRFQTTAFFCIEDKQFHGLQRAWKDLPKAGALNDRVISLHKGIYLQINAEINAKNKYNGHLHWFAIK